jgi:4-diphosphocytidyl-2-C-methyl-D-erythritol kinase
MLLQKNIPSGAGMGGGSADAAAALKGLNELWNLGLSHQELLALGLKLGADVPFMLTGGLARVGGIGEVISPLVPAPEVHLLFLQPCGGLSTGEVFKAYDSLDPSCVRRPETNAAQAALLAGDLPALARAMNNVLEGVSMQARPVMKDVCAALEQLGAVRAMMTGSGSVIYGVFADEAAALKALPEMQKLAECGGWGMVQHMHTLK